ncbi:MAG TPA: tyrosine-type recombinase/integrase [Ktedonobacteraceae bacterium]
MATLRNQALLWLFWEEGLTVSEACALQVGAVALHQGIVRLVCPGVGERRIALGQESQRALGLYLACLSQQGALHAEVWLFRTERGDRMTNNAVTLLFARINLLAGMADAYITPSMLRETFAVRYLQSGRQVHALQTHLGLHDRNSMKRFQQAAGLGERRPAARRRKKRKKRVCQTTHSCF